MILAIAVVGFVVFALLCLWCLALTKAVGNLIRYRDQALKAHETSIGAFEATKNALGAHDLLLNLHQQRLDAVCKPQLASTAEPEAKA